MIDKITLIRQLWRYLGPHWLAYRVGYTARLRTGLIAHQLPATDWRAQQLHQFLTDLSLTKPETYLEYRRGQAPTFFFAPTDIQTFQSYFARWDSGVLNTPVSIADEFAQGKLRYFEHTVAQVGFPPAWHRNPFTQQSINANQHWSQIDDFGVGDIKVIWEPSRFGFTYALVRAYWRSGNEQYAELFWRLVEDWQANNQPQQGPNWKCGQEISFRVMAWCFGLYGFLEATATTPERVAALAQMIAVSGERIEANLSYALSQRNNHGISEGVGLWTIGLLFPEFKSAAHWRARGRQALEEQGQALIYEDGAFAQHSVNYQRLMLHDYLWALRLGDLHGQPLSSQLKERVGKAGAFLYQLQDEITGQLPYYGQNDGALILPLNNCNYLDFRPVIQATHYYCTGRRCYNNGLWDEDLLWLFGPEAVEAVISAPQRTDLQAEVGGYYTLRAKDSFVFVRCATYRDRPGQADMLHLDLWWHGQNVALDAGTYSYNAPEPWDNPLAQTAYHNTVAVDDVDQMERVSKFLWLPWLRGRVHRQQCSTVGHLAYWEGEHDGYERLKVPVYHRRGILRLAQEYWLIFDRVSSRSDHRYRLHWLLADLPYTWIEEVDRSTQRYGLLKLQTASGPYYMQLAAASHSGTYSLVRADENSPRGWRSPYYAYREPALSVAVVAEANSLLYWTLFGPRPCQVAFNDTTMSIEATQERWRARFQLQMDSQHPMLTSATLTGTLMDSLEI
jgi:hypothetical protein